ncbi:MAG: hypothetical protein Q4A72_07145 [Bacillota bacterium]|nr:hypothetical protein [Bacillota bacterium]
MLDREDKKERHGGEKENKGGQIHTIASILLAVIFLAAFLYKVYAIKSASEQYKSSFEENEKIIDEVREKLVAASGAKEQTDTKEEQAKQEEVLKESLYSASKIGTDVAAYQNKYKDLDFRTQAEAFDANVQKLDKCFSETSKNARTPWYNNKSEAIDYEWEFMSTYSFSAEMIDVIWLAKDKRPNNNSVYAYAIGKYDVKNNVFTDMKWANTYLGAKHVGPTPSGKPAEKSEPIEDLVDKINSIEVEGREQTDEELQSIREAQEMLRQIEQNKNKN